MLSDLVNEIKTTDTRDLEFVEELYRQLENFKNFNQSDEDIKAMWEDCQEFNMAEF